MLRLSFEKIIVAEIRTVRHTGQIRTVTKVTVGKIVRKYFNNSAKDDGLG